ncbi:hypothetical protein BH11CYA1_BH11CYA1_08810 [soil metagenome]
MVTPVGADFSPGDIVGNTYEVIGYIGRGAMGYVYHVRHVGLPKEYALKTLSTEQITEKAWLRFQIEAQSIAKMFHPNIITIHNFAVHKASDWLEQPFYVMDLLTGRSLMEELRDNDPLTVARALPVFIQAASGIGYAHSKGIIHRDVKPGNVMLLDRPDASGATVKIVDFGIAKLTADSELAQQHLTSAGEVFGSPYYMSPEQGLGQTVDARSDIYSLGVTFFESLTGDAPFSASSAVDIMLKHQSAAIPQLNEVVDGGDFPAAVQVVVERMIAKDPSKRYQSMQEVVADLAAIQLGNPLPSDADFDGEQSVESVGRNVWSARVDDNESDSDEVLEQDLAEEDDESSEEADSQYDLEPLAGPDSTGPLEEQSVAESDLIPSKQVRGLTTIHVGGGLPKGQVIFLAVSVAAVVTSALAYMAIKSAGNQAYVKPVAVGAVPPKAGVNKDSAAKDDSKNSTKNGAGVGAVTSAKNGTNNGAKDGANSKLHSSSGNTKAKPKLDVEEDKEPGSSRTSTKPYGTSRDVKNGRMIDFDFPTDVYIGRIQSWNWISHKDKEVKAQGSLHYGPTDWLMFRPTRIVGRYPQYLKRFSTKQISAVQLVEQSNSDAIFEACTAMPNIDEVIIRDCKNLTSTCISSLSKFTELKKFDCSHSSLDGIALARATCWQHLAEFRASHCHNVTPMLEKLKASKDLTHLDVHESDLTYQDYKAISELSNLRELKFEEDLMTLNELKLLTRLPKLETLELWDCGLDEKAIPVLRQFKALKTIKIVTGKTLITLRDNFKKGLPGVKIE